MSTPLFIQEAKSGFGSALGHSQAAGMGTLTTLVAAVAEQTLIEEVTWSALVFSSLVGQLVIVVNNGTSDYPVAVVEVPAGTAALWSSGRSAINVTLPVGYSLKFAHNVQDGGGYITLFVGAHGGIVR